MPTEITTDAPTTEGTGQNTGAGAGAGSPAGGEAPQTPAELEGFTTEQQTRIDQIVADRLRREREAEQRRQQRTQQQEQERLAAEQGQFKTLAEQRAARVAELEAENARLAREAMVARVQARHKLPDDLAARLMGATEAELDADAKKLLALIPQLPVAPKTEGGAGNRPSGSSVPAAGAGASNGAAPAANKRTRIAQPGDIAW